MSLRMSHLRTLEAESIHIFRQGYVAHLSLRSSICPADPFSAQQ